MRFGWIALVVIGLGVFPDASAEDLVKNGSFEAWTGGAPDRWSLSVGATRNPRGERSEVKRGSGHLSLVGDARTQVWQHVGQRIAVGSGQTYRLTYTARVKGLRQERGQFGSCYVGLSFSDSAGKRLLLRVSDVRSGHWTGATLVVRAPPNTAGGTVGIFLAKSGRLDVKDVSVVEVQPRESFDLLVSEMDRHYSYFAHKPDVDWKALTARSRKEAVAASADEPRFVGVIKTMLSKLRDAHIWIRRSNGTIVPTHSPAVPRNFDYRWVARQLTSVQQLGRVAFMGRTREGYGYAAIGSLQGPDAVFRRLEAALEGMFDAPGMLIDLRGNGGGSEARAQRIAAMFAQQKRAYAKSRVRSGKGHTDFGPVQTRTIQPRRGARYSKPVVCLIGPTCMSSGEGFALMLKAMPHVTLVGLPTRGASGNPQPVALPNGVTVFYSRWVSLSASGKVLEGKGVQPDQRVRHEGAGDPTFEAAVRALKKRLTTSAD